MVLLKMLPLTDGTTRSANIFLYALRTVLPNDLPIKVDIITFYRCHKLGQQFLKLLLRLDVHYTY